MHIGEFNSFCNAHTFTFRELAVGVENFTKAGLLTRTTICGFVRSQEQLRIEGSMFREGRKLLQHNDKCSLQRSLMSDLNNQHFFMHNI